MYGLSWSVVALSARSMQLHVVLWDVSGVDVDDTVKIVVLLGISSCVTGGSAAHAESCSQHQRR